MDETVTPSSRIPAPRFPRGYVLVAGPDGAGKSTVVDTLVDQAAQMGVPVHRAHHRPHVLPRRGAGGPVTDPHAQPPRGAAASVLKLAVVFLDHLLGGHVKWRRSRREGLLLVERGWHDQVVDPRRYRLPEAAGRWVRPLGWALPRADLVLLLSGDPAALHVRKPEIGVSEVRRQLQRWRDVAPSAGRRVVEIDTVRSTPQTAAHEVLRALGDPPPGQHWRAVPLTPPRLDLACRGEARGARTLYQPFSPAARAGRVLGSVIRGRVVPAPLDDIDALLHDTGLRASGIMVMRSSSPSRLLFGLCAAGRLEAVLKVGPAHDARLRHEAAMLAAGTSPDLPFRRPELLWAGDWRERFVLATRAVPRSSSRRWCVEEVLPLAAALGRADGDGGPLVHGDFTPWNLLRTAEGPVLIDWESARRADQPLHDLAHFVLSEGALLGRYSPRAAVRLLTAPGSPGDRLLRARGHEGDKAPAQLRTYLAGLRPGNARAERFRTAMLGLVTP